MINRRRCAVTPANRLRYSRLGLSFEELRGRGKKAAGGLSVPGGKIDPVIRSQTGGYVVTSTYKWPRNASSNDSEALEQWLGKHGWEVDPTLFMTGARGPAVQVRRIGAAWQDGETGLLILPGEVVEYEGDRMRIAPRPTVASSPTP